MNGDKGKIRSEFRVALLRWLYQVKRFDLRAARDEADRIIAKLDAEIAENQKGGPK